MSSPLCANCSRDSSRAGLGIGPVAQVETETQVGIGVEVMCSQFEVIGPVEEVDSVPSEAKKVLSPWLKTGPVDEVRCSVVKLVFFAILSVASEIHVGPGGLVGLVSEVMVSVAEWGLGPWVTGPEVQATDSVLEF